MPGNSVVNGTFLAGGIIFPFFFFLPFQLLDDYTAANCIIPPTDLRYEKVSKIVLQILKSNEDIPEVKEKNWKVTVIDEEDQNAFVLPVRIF